ncbi:transposase [Bradyrhizobium sp. LM3.6]
MTARGKNRQFPTAFKLKAIKRVERGDGVLPVARELGISRKILHDWIKAWKAHGPEGLNRRPGPKPGPRKLRPPPSYDDKRSALTQAKARIAELERLVGRQQMDIDFFRQALSRALERPAAQGKPVPASSKSSKP